MMILTLISLNDILRKSLFEGASNPL